MGLYFFREFLRQPTKVAALVSDSDACIRRLLEHVDFRHAKTILEWGCGSGSVTRMILKHMAPDAKLITIEQNNTFVERITHQITDPRFTLIHDDVANTSKVLERQNIPTVDAVVSTLPVAALPHVGPILESGLKHRLSPHAVFVQYTYTVAYFRYGFILPNFLKQHFRWVTRRLVTWNLPPCIVYSAFDPIRDTSVS